MSTVRTLNDYISSFSDKANPIPADKIPILDSEDDNNFKNISYPILGNAAAKDVGSSFNNVAAGDDSRFPTADEKAALAGTGTPSISNKYVTEDGLPNADQIRKITYGTTDPSGTPSDGDIYMQYEV